MLSGIVETFWHHDGGSVRRCRERVLPNGRFQIVINLQTASGIVSGLRSEPVEVETSTIPPAVGIVLLPQAAHALFQPPADDFQNAAVSLDAAWGRWFHDFAARLQEASSDEQRIAIVRAMLIHAKSRIVRSELHHAVRFGLAAFSSDRAEVSDAAKSCGLSRRRFAELFRQQVGMPPKLYSRLMRFRRVVRQMSVARNSDLAPLSFETGYYDQPHLTNDFKDFSGMSPGSYLAAEKPSLNHIRIG